MELDEATRLLKATQLMLLGKDNQPISDLYYALQIAVDSIEELAERREAERWISVKERLPEDYGNYLVFTSDNDIDIGTYQPRYIVGTWSMCDANGFYWADDKDIKVIAWKPLPKPYESEDK